MKTLLINDTSGYHNGCKQVIKYIKEKYDITESIPTSTSPEDFKEYSQYDRVICNGEGSIHSPYKQPHARKLFRHLRFAQRAGCDTQIINAVIENVHEPGYLNIIRNCSNIEVREKLSHKFLRKKRIHSNIKPDLSYFVDVPYETHKNNADVYIGQWFDLAPDRKDFIPDFDWDNENYGKIDIFNDEWNDIVNKLRSAKLLITGRHHEMYAACVAECRFIATPGNTWKNQGLLASAGVDIPYDIESVLSGKYDAQYDCLWEYLRSFK